MSDPDPRLIPWVHDKLRSWGRQKWRLMQSPEGSPQSIMGRIVEYGPSAGDQGTRLQVFREGMTGDALDASLAIYRAMMTGKLTDRQYEVGVFVFYACKGYSIEEKARAMGICVSKIYKLRNIAHKNLQHCFAPEAEEDLPPLL